jgi:hypothetical protein
MLDVNMFCLKGMQFFENFTLCELDNFDVILKNTFLDVDEIDIFHNVSNMRVHANIGFKLMNLNVEYKYALMKVIVNLIVLAKELKSLSFVILMFLRESQWELKPQEARRPLNCILNSFNKFSKGLINKFLDYLPYYIQMDHEIEKVSNLALLPKALVH